MIKRKSVMVTAAVAIAIAAAPGVAAAQATKPAVKASPKGSAAGAVRTVEIKGTDDMKFSVTSIDAKPGERIRIVLVSVGSMPKIVMAHNWILLKKGTDEKAFVNASALARDTAFIAPAQKANVLFATSLIGAGEKTEVTITVPKVAGAYPYVCSFPGHWAAGMKGTLTVK
ncbi:MAG TPA: plastocyanin/azurin family copper-binding protein [Vicinamibacterales bacterium]|nr:plastocyanin/azurin family copper-binding protein [Vicinamibacterales bacterium]